MDSTKSLIKILIETIRQWQIHCDLDPSWHDQGEPVKMPHPWWALGRVDLTVMFLFHSVISWDTALLHPLYSSSITQFSVALHIKPPIWPNFPMSYIVLIKPKAWLTGVITSGSVQCRLSGPFCLTRRLSELLLSLEPAANVYHEEGLLHLWLSLISSIFKHPTIKEPVAFPG